MSILGDNKDTAKDAESTDLSSLLNVLEWTEDAAFGGSRRVDLNFVKELRSKVRNAWAHAPSQEMTEVKLNDVFMIANNFLNDLDKVFDCGEIKNCRDELQCLQANGLTNVVEVQLKNLLLLRKELCGDVSQMKEEIKNMKQDQGSDKQVIQEHEKKLKNLEDLTEGCSVRMEDISKEFQKWRENLDNLFNDFKSEMVSFREEIKGDISEIRADIKELQHTKKVGEAEQRILKSCLPEKSPQFIGRDTEVKKFITHLVEKDSGIVSMVGGPGFGKSTIAIEVAYRLSKHHHIPVIFSYLSNTSTVPEVALRLCLDVGVYPGEDPMSSLIFWLKNIERKVVLVMDNIEQLLEGETRSQFTELVRLLRKNSDQQLQIVTTSRTKFSIANLTIENVVVEQMDNDSSVELLRKSCPNAKVGDEYLHKLANLCGHVPLALCIAASRLQDVDDPDELTTWLTERPMETLQTSEPDHRIQKTIKLSFEMLSDKDKKAFVRLSVFDGNFSRNAAQEVINRDGLGTQDFLKNLVDRSLIERRDERFFIHSLIKRFLTDHDQLQEERKMAQKLMVEHFLKVCQALTLHSYSKDGFNDARELLKKDLHNVEETLKVCQGQGTNLSSNVIESLVIRSDIYQSSSRFFYNFVRNVLPQSVTKGFLESCLGIAKRRKEVAMEINFQCLLADQEGRKSLWNKSTKYMKMMEEVKNAFDSNEEVLKEDSALVSHFYYCYGRYLFNKVKASSSLVHLHKEAYSYLEKSFNLRENKAQSALEKADEAIALIQLGQTNKGLAKEYAWGEDEEKHERYMSCAENHYKRALMLADEFLGNHELTSHCYKVLGDLFFSWQKYEEALTYYKNAKNLHRSLRLDSGESMVYLLKNYGSSFWKIGRHAEAVEQLYEARDIADKLAEQHTPCSASLYFRLVEVLNDWKPGCPEAKEHAKVAIEMKEFLKEASVQKMEQVIKGGLKTRRYR